MHLLLFLPLVLFWLLLFIGFERLRWKGLAIAFAVWMVLRFGLGSIGFVSLFPSVVALLDLVLLLLIFRPAA